MRIAVTKSRPVAALEAIAAEAATAARPTIAIATTTVTRLAATFGEGEQREVPGALDRRRQRALVLGAGAGLAARLDHPTVGDEAAQARDILIVDVLDAIDAEAADLAARERAATAATAAEPARRTRRSFAATRLFSSLFSHVSLSPQSL
jgi:hypothetical protein